VRKEVLETYESENGMTKDFRNYIDRRRGIFFFLQATMLGEEVTEGSLFRTKWYETR
jgi:hypothetical protein